MSTNQHTVLDAASLKNAMLAFLEKSAERVTALRDKEWLIEEIDRLKNQGRITGKGATQIKSTGIVRQVDDLGRLVIPKEIRRTYGIGNHDPLEVYYDEVTKFICIRKHEVQCHFCSGTKDITEFKEKYICEVCIGEFSEQVLG